MNWFHRHHYKLTGIKPMNLRNRWAAELGLPPESCTQLLFVCDCGDAVTKTLSGHWTLDQLSPAPDKSEVDKDFFRKIGVRI